jgi:CRISPR-associated protein Csd1
MILNRLYELAVRENLLANPAFEELPVPFVIQLGRDGEFLGIDGQRPRPAKKGEGRIARKLTIPRPHGNTASQGFARYFADTVARVLPVVFNEKNREKEARSRTTFWKQIDEAADATDDPGLRAVQAFGRDLTTEPVAERVRQAVAEKEATGPDRVTFALFPDGGPTILERPAVGQWYAEHFRRFTAAKQTDGPIGFCTITGTVGPLPVSHPVPLTGVPGGLPTGLKIVSFDKPAFQHYGLEGAANAAIGYEAADGYARGFQWLRGRRDHHFVVGGTLFLYWTREKVDLEDINALGQADPDQVRKLLEAASSARANYAIEDASDFYLLAVSGNSARVVIRDYLERPLGHVRAGIRQWFADLSIADPSKEYQGRPNAAFPVWLLAAVTALDADRVAPDTQIRLMHSALTGGPLPDSVLTACLSRLRAEGSAGFRAARMGLIKLCLNRTHFRERDRMPDTLNPDERNPAYVYGRLLRVFEEIQCAALGDVNSTVVDKFYGTFSAAPALVFARLFANAQNHLRKVRGDDEGKFVALDRRLTDVCSLLPPSPPRGTLPLSDQGRFALGYYHQKARTFAEIAERKAAKAEKAKAAQANQ